MKYIFPFILSICYFLSATAQDTLSTTYPNSNSRWQKIYEGNQKVAENIYHENGAEWMTVRYETAQREAWKWYYDNGNPYFEATIINDELQGTYKIWYENGQLAERLTFEDNIENGLATFYHPNGQLAMKGHFRDGKMIGDWLFFDENGELPTGDWRWAFAASPDAFRMEGKLKHGRQIGTWQCRGTANMGKRSQLVMEQNW
ncbi:MAG: toxin-antitoxin system YwqK family antitoxin [Bacteroidota bacterium]